MIENHITQERILQGEPHLDSYLSDSQLDYEEITSEAFDEYLNDVKNHRVDLRKLGKRLPLEATALTKTAAYTGTKSNEDLIERRKLVIDVTVINGAAVFKLEGTNDNGTTYYEVRYIQFNNTGKHTYLITDVYKRYRLSLVSITSASEGSETITYTSFLYETTFDFPLIYLIRSKIYHSLYHRGGDDAFKEKSDTYMDKYRDKLANAHYFYDADDSGDITVTETEVSTTDVTFTL